MSFPHSYLIWHTIFSSDETKSLNGGKIWRYLEGLIPLLWVSHLRIRLEKAILSSEKLKNLKSKIWLTFSMSWWIFDWSSQENGLSGAQICRWFYSFFKLILKNIWLRFHKNQIKFKCIFLLAFLCMSSAFLCKNCFWFYF